MVEAEKRVIHFEVDDEELETTHRELTPVQIMKLAGINPETDYLVEIEGHHQRSLKDHPNDPVVLHDGSKFVSVSTGPTPTS
jgi:hypothetical protein